MSVHSGFGPDVIYDADGNKLEHVTAAWQASDCHWASKRKEIAHEGDVVRLHGLLYNEARKRAHMTGRDMEGGAGDDKGPTCGAPHAIAAERALRFDAMLATIEKVRSITPQDVREAVLDQSDDATGEDAKPEKPDAKLLAEHMSMYIEWPHIDGKFVELYGTMAGRVTWNWYDGDPERDDRQ